MYTQRQEIMHVAADQMHALSLWVNGKVLVSYKAKIVKIKRFYKGFVLHIFACATLTQENIEVCDLWNSLLK